MAKNQAGKPGHDETHVRPMDDPARGQGDKLDEKLPHGKRGETTRPEGDTKGKTPAKR